MSKFAILVAILCFPAAHASVWGAAKASAYTAKGRVHSLSVNQDDTLVRLAVRDDGSKSSHIETFKLCSRYMGAVGNVETNRLAQLRDAFDSGEVIEISYDSPFDHCVTSVTRTKNLRADNSPRHPKHRD